MDDFRLLLPAQRTKSVKIGVLGCTGFLFLTAAAIAGGVTLGVKAVGWIVTGAARLAS